MAMGWLIVSDSFVPRLMSYSCLRTEQLQGEIYPVETKANSPITLGLQEIFKYNMSLAQAPQGDTRVLVYPIREISH